MKNNSVVKRTPRGRKTYFPALGTVIVGLVFLVRELLKGSYSEAVTVGVVFLVLSVVVYLLSTLISSIPSRKTH